MAVLNKLMARGIVLWDRARLPLLHGYADVIVTVALIVLPFIAGFDDSTAAPLF